MAAIETVERVTLDRNPIANQENRHRIKKYGKNYVAILAQV
jgi:hypothetical protein